MREQDRDWERQRKTERQRDRGRAREKQLGPEVCEDQAKTSGVWDEGLP